MRKTFSLLLFGCLLVSGLSCNTNSQPDSGWPDPPNWKNKPLMARYLAHYAQWGVVSGITPMAGLYAPYGTLQSFADGPLGNSNGIPYFYISQLSDTYNNMQYNNTMTLTVSMAESDKCIKENIDPEEPPCARVTLLGQMIKVTNGTEVIFAKTSMFARHPAMLNWPSGHGWDFYKLDIKGVYLIDMYGPLSVVDVKEYYKANPVKNSTY